MHVRRLLRVTSVLTGLGGLVCVNAAIRENPRCVRMKNHVAAAFKQRLNNHSFGISTPTVFALNVDPHAQITKELIRFRENTGILGSGFKKDVMEALTNENSILMYNTKSNNPIFSYEYLTKESVNSTSDICKVQKHVKPDERIPDLEVYEYEKDSPYVWGQLAALSNHRKSSEDEKDTFLASNLVPMDKRLREGLWLTLEHFIRDLATRYDAVHVVSGPMYSSQTEKASCSKKRDKPDFFFKHIVVEHQDKYHLMSYLVPNYQDLATWDHPIGSYYEQLLPWCTALPSMVDRIGDLNVLENLMDHVTSAPGGVPDWLVLPKFHSTKNNAGYLKLNFPKSPFFS